MEFRNGIFFRNKWCNAEAMPLKLRMHTVNKRDNDIKEICL